MQASEEVGAPEQPCVCLGVFVELYSTVRCLFPYIRKVFKHHPKDTQHSFNNYQMTIYLALWIMGNAIIIHTTG